MNELADDEATEALAEALVAGLPGDHYDEITEPMQDMRGGGYFFDVQTPAGVFTVSVRRDPYGDAEDM